MSAEEARGAGRGAVAAGLLALAVYLVGVCPVVFWGDSAELSRRAVTLELSPVARGYPLHRVLTWVAGRIAGDPALGANLVSAVFGAVSVALVYEVARRIAGSWWAGATAAVVTGLAHTFWTYSEVAEVYTLHTAILLAALLVAVLADSGGVRARWALGAVLGLSLLHHRMIVFAIPGIVWWMWTGVPAGQRGRAVRDVLFGVLAGALPFVVLCLLKSRSPPPETASRVWWWFEDVFMGGERNASFVLGEGRKGMLASAVYLGRWLVFNLPGPALLLAVAGFLRAPRRAGAFLGVLTLASAWFPLRYDWTGDQYTFLIPRYPVLAIAAGIAVARAAERRPRLAAALLASVAAAPLLLYGVLAGTDLGPRTFPGLSPSAARDMLWPPRTGDREPLEWSAERLRALPPAAHLHADWGDGQVFLYLQEARGLRPDVRVEVWNWKIKLGDGSGEEWVSALPFQRELPKAVAAVRDRLEPRGDGLFRVKPR